MLPPGAQIVTPGEATDDAVRLTRAYRSNLPALALVALFTGAFLVYATQSLAVARRRREIALLHAMGMTVREQLAASLLSGVIVGALGAALGVVLGALVARAGLAAFGADLRAGYFRGVAPALDVSAGEYLVFLVLGVGAALVATFGPAREAASVPAAAALKAGDEAPMAARTHGRIALVLFAAGVLALALPPLEGIALPGYASIACLLLGAVFLTPSIASAVSARLRTDGPAWRQVAVAQLRGTARRATVSIAAVLVSFSLMVAMAIMVFSFRMSLEAWMQRILPADLYVRAGSAATGAYLDVDAQRSITAFLKLAERVRDKLGLMGWPLPWAMRRDAAGNLRFEQARPGKKYVIEVDQAAGRVRVEERTTGWRSILGFLHGGTEQVPNAPFTAAWGYYTEVVNWFVLFAVGSGIWLWARRAREKRVALAVLVGSTVLSLAWMGWVYFVG